MKRPLAVVGFTVLLTDMLAVFMPQGVVLPFAAFFALSAVLVWRFMPKLLYVRTALIAACVALLLMSAYNFTAVNKSEALIGSEHTLTARVTSTTPGFSSETVNAHVKIITVDGQKYSGSTLIYSFERCKVGDVITFTGEAAAPKNDSYLYSNYANGVFAVFNESENTAILSHENSLASKMHTLQTAASDAITQLIPRETGAVLAAMSTGDKTKLDTATKTYFKHAGISHVLVVSGLHLSMLAAAFYYCVKRFVKRRTGGVITCVFIVCIMLFMGMSASVIRSGIALLLVYSGTAVNRQSDIYTSLGAAALLLCLVNPYTAVDIGLLLSLSSTLAVVLVGDKRSAVIQNTEEPSHLKLFAVNAAFAFSVPAAATLSTLPVLICIGEGVSLVSVFTGVIAVALLPFIVVLGLATAAFYYIPLCMFAARAAAFFGAVLVNVIIKIAVTAASLPFAFVHIYGLVAFGIFIISAALIWCGVSAKLGIIKSVSLAAVFALVTGGVYMLYDYNVVHITLAGNSLNPSVVITQGFDTAVVFRGSQSRADVEDVLELYNRSAVNFTADLRLNANTPALSDAHPSNVLINANENIFSAATYSPFRDIIITLHRQANGVYAIIGCGGYDICVSSGSVNLANEKGIDVYVAGGTQPKNLTCDKIAVYSNAPQWAQNADSEIIYADEILLRENTSVILR